MKLRIFICVILCHVGILTLAQKRGISIKQELELLSPDIPGLNNEIEVSIEDLKLSQFIRAVAIKNKINVDFLEDLNERTSNNFSKITVLELFNFLCDKYHLDISVNNNIITFYRMVEEEEKVEVVAKEVLVFLNSENLLLSYDLRNDTLNQVAKKLTDLSGKNIVLSSDLFGKIVNGYVKDVTLKQALEQLSYSNNLKLQTNDSITFYLSSPSPVNNNSGLIGTHINQNNTTGLNIKENGGLISLEVNNISTSSVIEAVAKELKKNFFFFSEIKGNSTLKLSNVSFETLLDNLFNGTDNTYRIENNTYLIGDRNVEGIRTTKIINLKYRTVDKVVDNIPTDLKKDIEIKTFVDLNCLILCGAESQIKEIENFLFEIDKVVPVISIEVIILDVRKNYTIASGVQAGVGKSKSESTYTSIFPNLDVNLNSSAVNNIISSINSLGIINLGKVTPNFYLSLKLSENNGELKIVSTPRLAALNGNEAKLKIGETRYYAEQTNNVYNNQSLTTINTVQYKPIQANLEIGIKPSVSTDEQITLDINIEQSSFTEQLIKDGPFGTISRTFHSNIRVKNQEMVILGGLNDKSFTDNGLGTPFLSRIPIIKWFFSSRSKSTKKSNLVVLIKPTVYY